MITSRQNPRIKEFMQLAKKSKDGRVLAEGIHLLKEALMSNVEIEAIILAPRRANDEVNEFIDMARGRGIEIVEVSEDCYKKFSILKSSESVAMIFRVVSRSIDTFVSGGKKIVVLDGIQDPGNAGAIVRIAEATGMDGCVFIGGSAITNGKFLRATMGAVFRVPCINIDFNGFKEATQGTHFRLISTELDKNARSFSSIDYSVKDSTLGICFGSEGQGVSGEVLSISDESIFIPMSGKIESLNVAVAAGIVLYYAGVGQNSSEPEDCC